MRWVKFPLAYSLHTDRLPNHVHCTMYVVQCRPQRVCDTVTVLQCAEYIIQLCTVHCILYSIHCALYNVQCTSYDVQRYDVRTMYIIHRISYIVQRSYTSTIDNDKYYFINVVIGTILLGQPMLVDPV